MKRSKQNLMAAVFLLLFSSICFAATTWEYLVKTYPLMGNDKALTQQLNQLGKQHWELVNCTEGGAQLTCVFKRPSEPN